MERQVQHDLGVTDSLLKHFLNIIAPANSGAKFIQIVEREGDVPGCKWFAVAPPDSLMMKSNGQLRTSSLYA